MRICFVADAGHTNLLSWARYLAGALGHEVHAITFNPPGETVPGLVVHRVSGWAARSRARYLLAAPRVRAMVRRISPDVLVGYRINSYGLLAVLTGWRPLVLVAQGSDLFYPRDSALHRWVCRLTTARADLLQTWAAHMTRRLVDLGGDPRRVFTLPKGVDTDVFAQGAHRNGAGGRRLVSTRQLRREYNHHLVLEAIARVAPELPDLEYVVCGDGEDRVHLEGLARNLGIADRVRFVGRVAHHDLPRHLHEADVYVSQQPSDGVSASLLEAMACGAFPIVTDNEANRSWVTDGVNGFLVPAGDVAALAARLRDALRDTALRQRARETNRGIIDSRGSMAANMRRMEARYRDLLVERRRETR